MNLTMTTRHRTEADRDLSTPARLVTPQADIREKISEKLYNGLIRADEVFVSDGAKCDIGRLQMMFGPGVTSAVQVSQFGGERCGQVEVR